MHRNILIRQKFLKDIEFLQIQVTGILQPAGVEAPSSEDGVTDIRTLSTDNR
jgi:hypothetical protein